MDINDMIKRYGIIMITNGADAGKIMIRNTHTVASDNALETIKASKPDIIAEYQRRQVAADERKAKIEAIERLKVLESAIADLEKYHDEFNRRMEDENMLSFSPDKPSANIAEIKAKCPRATAYLKAEGYTYARNYAKASAGRKALERIINGEDYTAALADMEKEWDDHCKEHLFD